MILKRIIVMTLFFIGMLLFIPDTQSQAQPPQIPPAIQKIIDKAQQGKQLTPADQKALSDWGQAMSKAYGQGGNKDVDENKKGEELVLTVRMKAQSQSQNSYNGVERPPGIGTADIQSQGSDSLAFEYTGERRFRVNWGKKDGKDYPYLEKIEDRSSLTHSGSGKKLFKQTYNPKYGGSPCTVSEEASWTRETPPAAKRVSRGPDAHFKDKENIIVEPFMGGCENVMKGKAFTRDECSHPNRPSEGHPKVESIVHPGTKCEELLHAAGDNDDFTKKLQGKVDWKKATMASGTASYTMNVTDWMEYPERYSPRKAAFRRSGTVTVDWSLTSEAPDPNEVTVEVAGYEAWIPEGNVDNPQDSGIRPLTITATVHKKGNRKKLRQAYLNIALPYVSKNKGICGNWPRNAGEDEGLRFREKDFPKKDGLLYVDRTHLKTDVPVEEVMFRVHSYDYGAWGTLRITARDEDGRDIKVRVRGKDTPDLDIPQDDDSNRIADSWKKEKALGRNMTDDDEAVTGQDAKGDGVTLYDEYRGLVVLENKEKVFRRLDPSKKELFVIDPGNSFDASTWEKTSSIKAYKVDESLTKADPKADVAPMVNYLSQTAPAQVAYAVKIETVAGDVDPNPAVDDKGKSMPKTSQLPGNWVPGYSHQAGSVKSTTYCKVFPERVRKLVAYVVNWVETGLIDPGSDAGILLRTDPFLGFTIEEARTALAMLRSPSVREVVAQKILTAITIHEVGHCTGGLPDHRKVPPAGHEDAIRGCLMFNVADKGRLRMVIRTTLDRAKDPLAFPYVQFCRNIPVAGYACFKTLNVKDW